MRNLDGWEPAFHFYQGGVTDAVKVILSTFEYPTQRQRFHNPYGYAVHPIMHDYDQVLEALMRNNALPMDYANKWDHLELAVQEVDEAVYAELKKYLGGIDAQTVDATFINNRNDCLVVVEY